MAEFDRPRLYVDFNEMPDEGLVLLAKTDTKVDSSGEVVRLAEGKRVFLYEPDEDEDGNATQLRATGIAERNTSEEKWAVAAAWCCRIDRWESD